MATVYNVLDTRDKQELTERIDSDKNELSKTIQNTKTELQSNIDALESQHDEDKTELQTQIDSLESTKADKTEITAHNASTSAHNDIRLLIQNLTTKLNTIADSDDSTLDQMSEIVEYIKNNKELIDSITTTKVSVSDIINNLVTNVANKPLSAAMGVELKALIDAIPDTTLATVNEKILEHNVSADAHEDIRNDITSLQSDVATAQTTAETAQTSADSAQDDADEALQRLNSLEVGSGKIDRTVEGSGILTCEDPLIGAPLIETAVRGRTVNNLWPKMQTATINGATLTVNGDGSFTMSGTATAATEFRFPVQGIVAGAQYTLRSSRALEGLNFALVSQKQDGSWLANSVLLMGYDDDATATGTTAEDAASFFCKVIVTVGVELSGTYRLMLVEGDTAPDCFTPPASITSAQPGNLVTAGKNLANAENVVAINAVTVSNADNSDGSFDVTATADGVYAFAREYVTINPGTYVFNASVSGGSGTVQVISNNNILANNGQGFTVDNVITVELRYLQKSSVQGTAHVSGWQLELGSTATDYEPPQVTEVALPETDPLMYVYDRGDEMVIAQDGAVTVERNIYHELFDGGTNNPINPYRPVDADGYQYIALNTTKDKQTNLTISMEAVVSDRFATGKRAPGYVVLTTGSVSGEGRNHIAMLFCFEPGKFADSTEARQWFADNPTSVWFAGEMEIEYIGTIDSPALPAQTSNIWFSSNIPVNDFSVRYWLPNGELVEELYRTGATEEISDNEIISIWNGATGDIVEATNADIEAIFE